MGPVHIAEGGPQVQNILFSENKLLLFQQSRAFFFVHLTCSCIIVESTMNQSALKLSLIMVCWLWAMAVMVIRIIGLSKTGMCVARQLHMHHAS